MLTLIAAPDTSPVSLEEQKDHMNVSFDDQDDMIEAFVTAGTQKLDGAAGILGRCLITQTWRLTLDRFPFKIVIPLLPVQRVSSIKYIDANGDEQTHSDWTLFGVGSDEAYLLPRFGTSWPTPRTIPESVMVEFVAGYGDDPEDVPEPLREAIRLWAAHLYDNRPSTEEGTPSFVRPLDLGFYQHIADYRRFAF
ncbi:MAG: hypothetical protein AB7F72_01715 [Afipia sp.]